MAINQGLRQGPMTSADTPPPQHTLILSGRLTHAHTLLQTWYATASSLHFVVYVLIPQRQLSHKALYIQYSWKVVSSFILQTQSQSNSLSSAFETKLAPRRRWKTPPLICHLNSCSLLTRSYAFICCGEPSGVMQMRDDSVIVWGISME